MQNSCLFSTAGKQFRAVVISTVRTRETVNKAHITALPQASGNQQENEFYYAFLSEERLLNTAFNRAKSLIYCCRGPSRTLLCRSLSNDLGAVREGMSEEQ